jgi:hypothetical protein
MKAESAISVEGVDLNIEWGKFVVGASFFIPCINHKTLIREVTNHAIARKVKIKGISRIENGMWGVRFWRIV